MYSIVTHLSEKARSDTYSHRERHRKERVEGREERKESREQRAESREQRGEEGGRVCVCVCKRLGGMCCVAQVCHTLAYQ